MNKVEVIFAKAYINCKCDKNDDEYKTIVSALEKQIPKKPRADNYGWLYCPNCNETFSMFDNLHRRMNCCGGCGQRLDWSKTNKRSDTE